MEEKKCSHHNCNLDIYGDDKCVLHCKKKKEYDVREQEIYEDFNKALIHNIAQQLEESSNNDDAIIDKESAIQILNGESFQSLFSNDEWMKDVAENTFFNIINCANIIFPPRKPRDNFDYEKVLTKLKAIYFNYCEFHTSNLNLSDTQCFFQDCKFHKYWTLYDYKVLKNQDDVIYQCCVFEEDISVYSAEDKGISFPIFNESQFDYTCRFESELRFDNVKFKKSLFYSAQKNYLIDKKFIKALTFNNCIFEHPFKLNNYKIDYFSCTDTVFKNKSKFEFKKNEVGEFELLNTNFKSLVDCYKTEFKSFKVEKSIFEKFTGFEQCNFGEEKKSSNIALFQYATFLDFVNFREAKFYNGLDLQNANLKEYPNFLDIYVEPKSTNKETFRIIKHSFDKVGNIIEANKYFAYEMRKEREHTSIKDDFNKKAMLNLNYWISDFGQSWIRPLILILIVVIFHTLLIYGIDSKIFQVINPSNPIYDFLKWIVGFSNDLAKNILPFKKPLIEGKEFISLFFLIIYSTLIYNLVIAVKRITKR